jgi:hypothetical protein
MVYPKQKPCIAALSDIKDGAKSLDAMKGLNMLDDSVKIVRE